MNITYIIGNGFDINLGLKTSYESFYNWYVRQSQGSDSDVVKKFKEEINNYIEKKGSELNWSDLEYGLGLYSEAVPPDQFLQLYADVVSNLKTYLNGEYRFFDRSLYDVEKFRAFLEDPISGHFSYVRTKILQSFVANYKGENEINILSFNYTNTIEDLLGDTDGWRTQNGSYVKIRPIAHIHHTLSEGDIVLGVNDISQIANPAYESQQVIHDLFIKPRANDVLEGNTHIDAEHIILDTNLFVLFGVSVGATDRRWWNLIGNRLTSSPAARMIWFVHDNSEFSEFADFLYRDAERRLIPEFKSLTGLSVITAGNIDERIFVTLSDKMFRISKI